MAGHSKFKNIMHRKGAQDAKRAKIFTKLGRELTVAAKIGGDDVDSNPRLRAAIAAARAQNMPKDNIQRAIQKGAGGGDGDNYEEIRYEGYGPGGVAVIVEALTDNRNRTAAEVRSYFTKFNGSLGETGSVSFQFERVGMITYPASVAEADAVFEQALEAGADDVESDDETHEITTSIEAFNEVRDALEAGLGEAEEAKLGWKPTNTTPVDADKASTLMKLIDALEDSDDVQSVWGNHDVSDEVLASLAG